MKSREEYISGSHHFWTHFLFGFVFGGAFSIWFSSSIFESGAAILITAGTAALVIAYCFGRWGDPLWRWVVKHVSWLPLGGG